MVKGRTEEFREGEEIEDGGFRRERSSRAVGGTRAGKAGNGKRLLGQSRGGIWLESPLGTLTCSC